MKHTCTEHTHNAVSWHLLCGLTKIRAEMSIIREEGVCFFTHDDAKAVIERGIHNSVEAIGRIHKKRLDRFLCIRRAKVLC